MLLETKGLYVNYGPIEALRDVNMHIETGETVAFIGHNGAGKSTLLKTISGLLKPYAGTVEFEEKNISRIAADKIVRLGISHSPEGRQIFEDSTVYRNMEIGAYIRKDKAAIKADIEHYCEMFPILGTRKNQKAGTLSGGEQQMLAIVRALMSKPKLLMLDEPSLGLAPVAVNVVYETIEKIKADGVTILLVEQNAMKALEISDRAYVIASGEIMLDGKSSELMKNDQVRQAYLGG